MSDNKKNQRQTAKDRREEFVKAWLSIESPTIAKAAKKIGLNESSCRNYMCDDWVLAQIEEAKQKRMERLDDDADRVYLHLRNMMESDVGDIMYEDGGLKPLSEWPKIWRQMLNGMDIQRLYADKEEIGQILKTKFVDKMRVIELFGKHIAVGAFQERLAVTDDTGLAEKILKARQRTPTS